MGATESIRRTSEIEEVTNLYFIHPVSNRLTLLFARVHISANAVSLTGMLFGILAGVCYYHYQDVRFVLAGFILMIGWHVMDGADGQLARLTQTQSEAGKILDGICDYVTFIAVYAGLALALSDSTGPWVWLLVIAAGVCHAAQAAAYEAQRQEYEYWGNGKTSAKLASVAAEPQSNAGAAPSRGLRHMLYRAYTGIQLWVAGGAAEFHEKLAAIMERDAARVPLIRARYRKVFAPSVRRWSVLSANYRTIGIFIAAFFQVPQYYFVFEIVGLSAILIFLIARQRMRYVAFLETLGAA